MERKQAKLNKERKGLENHYSEVASVSSKVQKKIEAEQRKAAEKARKMAEAAAAKKLVQRFQQHPIQVQVTLHQVQA